MENKHTNLCLGLALGTLVGVLTAKKRLEEPRMPNAKIWQRILTEGKGQIPAAIKMARVQQTYASLLTKQPIFENPVYNIHIKNNILPGLALYQTLRRDGLGQQEALVEVDQLFLTWFGQFPPMNMRLNRLMAYTPQNFKVFRRMVHWTKDKLFPEPGWIYEKVEAGEDTLAFNIHTCFYLQILNYYDAPELTPAFCKLDDYLMAAMPPTIQWGRTQTIGTGAAYCDFRWFYASQPSIVDVQVPPL